MLYEPGRSDDDPWEVESDITDVCTRDSAWLAEIVEGIYDIEPKNLSMLVKTQSYKAVEETEWDEEAIEKALGLGSSLRGNPDIPPEPLFMIWRGAHLGLARRRSVAKYLRQ